MGYRYYYSMAVENIETVDADNISAIIEDESGYSIELSYNTYTKTGFFQLGDVSWDNASGTLKRISEQYPDKVFEMVFEGDSWDDRGSVYAKNGRTQTCMLIVDYEKPDEFFN